MEISAFIFISGRNLMPLTGWLLKMARGRKTDNSDNERTHSNLFHFRILAADRNIVLDVYSGTHGAIQLSDYNGIGHDIFLYLSGSSKQIPVPKLFYKILLNRADNSGVVLIGVNHPYLTLEEIKKDYVICTDYSDQITYINWQKDNIERGFSYACTVNDFVKVVPHVSVSAGKLLV